MYHGSCACESVRFEITQPCTDIIRCHCSLCRRGSGSGGSAFIVAPVDGFKWMCGEEKISTYTRDSGATKHYCQVCASPVPHLYEGNSYIIPAGSLLGEIDFKIGADIYVESKAQWVDRDNESKVYAEDFI